MKSHLFPNKLQQNCENITPRNIFHQQPYRTNRNTSSSGFTLLEVLVAIVIVGILSAIIGPSWLGFINIQHLNKANDNVFSALQEAQRQAKKTKRGYSVSFRKNNKNTNIVEYAIYPTKNIFDEKDKDVDPDDVKIWKPLGEELGINPEKFLVATNLTDKNNAKGDKVKSLSETKTIAFDYRGTLPLPKDAEMPFKIVLATPNKPNSNKPSDAKRCVIVETLVGGIRTAKNEDCDNNTWR
ncbi:MAG: type II secretion system protein [Rivularia sp. (in: cyanobacteria)]